MSVVEVSLEDRAYKIHIEEGLLENISEYIGNYYDGKRITIITDENVNSLYGEALANTLKTGGFIAEIVEVKPGESSKSFKSYESVINKLAETGHQRTDLILAFGGGVVGDLAGFVASSYLRGVPFIQVPTSLLAQIDSSVGGKTGINIPSGKNLVGAIYQPKAVLIDPLTLDTLPEKYLRDGIGEAIKYGFIDRPDLLDIFGGGADDEDCLIHGSNLTRNDSKKAFEHVLANRNDIIRICCESKRDFVVADEFDFGKRMILNYGHTIGHAIEKVHNYETYTHGEAVAMGMYFIQSISEAQKISDEGYADCIKNLLKRYDLYNRDMLSPAEIWIKTIAKDKKNLNSKLNVIFVEKPGKPIIYETSLEGFEKMMKEVLE